MKTFLCRKAVLDGGIGGVFGGINFFASALRDRCRRSANNQGRLHQLAVAVRVGSIFLPMSEVRQNVVSRVFPHFSHGLLNCR